MDENAGKQFIGTRTPEEFVKALERPRKIILLVKAGDPVDWTIDQIKPLLEAGRHHHRRRQLLLQGHRAAREGSEGRGLQLHRLGRLGRREGRAVGAVADAGRRPRSLRADSADLGGHRGEGRRRAVRHLHRAGRRRPLRQDGAQRHRVRRHAAHRRSLRHHAARARHVGGRDGRRLRRVEPRRPRIVPHRDHREDSARQRPGDGQAPGRPRARQGRAEGDGQVDERRRARPRRRHPDDQRRGRRAQPLFAQRRARRGAPSRSAGRRARATRATAPR